MTFASLIALLPTILLESSWSILCCGSLCKILPSCKQSFYEHICVSLSELIPPDGPEGGVLGQRFWLLLPNWSLEREGCFSSSWSAVSKCECGGRWYFCAICMLKACILSAFPASLPLPTLTSSSSPPHPLFWLSSPAFLFGGLAVGLNISVP